MRPPCKNCNERKQGCHSKCERYLQFRKWSLQRYSENNSRAVVEGYCVDNTRNTKRRANHGKKI